MPLMMILSCVSTAPSCGRLAGTTQKVVADPSTVGCCDGNLYGITDFGNAALSVVLVMINNSTKTDYYVAFNRQIGINSGTQEAPNQVMVTRQAGEGTGYAELELVAKLGVGGTWSRTFGGKNMTVTVLSINLSNSPAFAQMCISKSANFCGPAPKNVPTNVPMTPAPTMPLMFTPSRAPTTVTPSMAPNTPVSTMPPKSTPLRTPTKMTPSMAPTTPVPIMPPTSSPSRTLTTKTPSRAPTTRSSTCIGLNQACTLGPNSCCPSQTCKLSGVCVSANRSGVSCFELSDGYTAFI